MKKRSLILFAAALCLCAVALLLHFVRGGVSRGDRRDFAAETFAGQSGARYGMYSLFCPATAYLTPDGAMAAKVAIEDALRAESISPAGHYKFAASVEQEVTATREAVSFSAIATVYFGDYYALHPDRLLVGAFPDFIEETTDCCVLDSYAAWRLFGSTNVCGMEMQIGGKDYTVAAVIEPLGAPYTSYYGLTPRVYIRYDSAAMRGQNLSFTAVEGILPEPISDFGKNTFTAAVQSYGEDVICNTGRFSVPRLFSNLGDLSALGVMEGKTYPYYENVSRVMETKCTLLFAFEFPLFLLSGLLAVCGILMLVLPPLKAWRLARAEKKKHAIL
ncbi:MAG: ABC transporter permease [Clostridia bacterium]|nr:ABC transporter permease [Clostridia bacterium]